MYNTVIVGYWIFIFWSSIYFMDVKMDSGDLNMLLKYGQWQIFLTDLVQL